MSGLAAGLSGIIGERPVLDRTGLTGRYFAEFSYVPEVALRQGAVGPSIFDAIEKLGFKLEPVAEADSLTVQKELVARQPGLYSVLGPYSIAAELRSGRLQATKLVRPDLCRNVTLALPRQGKLSPACRVVAATVQQLVESWGNQLTEPSTAR